MRIYKYLFVCGLLVNGCGASINLEKEFTAVQTGESKSGVIAKMGSTLTTDSFNVGGFSIERIEYIDVKHRYSFILASTPINEAKVLSKTQLSKI